MLRPNKFLDTGSQRSYITKIRRWLNLQSISKGHLSIESFGERLLELKSDDFTTINSSKPRLNSIKIPVKTLYDFGLCSIIQGKKILLNTKDYSNVCQLEFINDG